MVKKRKTIAHAKTMIHSGSVLIGLFAGICLVIGAQYFERQAKLRAFRNARVRAVAFRTQNQNPRILR